MADYSRDSWVPVQVLTPREREVEKRLSELEQVVSKIAKTIFYDDSMTEAQPFMTNTANFVPDSVLELKDARIMELEKENLRIKEELRVVRKHQQQYRDFVAEVKDSLSILDDE